MLNIHFKNVGKDGGTKAEDSGNVMKQAKGKWKRTDTRPA